MFGPGALGYGDVKLSLAMGAMLGFHRIFFALILGDFVGRRYQLARLAHQSAGQQAHLFALWPISGACWHCDAHLGRADIPMVYELNDEWLKA